MNFVQVNRYKNDNEINVVARSAKFLTGLTIILVGFVWMLWLAWWLEVRRGRDAEDAKDAEVRWARVVACVVACVVVLGNTPALVVGLLIAFLVRAINQLPIASVYGPQDY